MNNLNIATKIRLTAVLAPVILAVAALAIAGAFYQFGALPRSIVDNQYVAARAAEGMENALYKMDWGRMKPDGAQIVLDQQRRFIDQIETARTHITSREQAEKIEKIANDAKPLFDTMRIAQQGDESLEPKLRDLEGTVADLIGAEEATLQSISAAAETRSRTMIIITVLALVVVPWICFVVISRMASRVNAELREIRRRIQDLSERHPETAADIRPIDEALNQLGFPKPNPMLAE
jgi:hypothetical protein